MNDSCAVSKATCSSDLTGAASNPVLVFFKGTIEVSNKISACSSSDWCIESKVFNPLSFLLIEMILHYVIATDLAYKPLIEQSN